MSKNEFLYKLKKKLRGVPKNELEERLNFYSEMIDDRIDEGFSEHEAVARIGTVEDVANQILREYPSLIDENKKIVGGGNFVVACSCHFNDILASSDFGFKPSHCLRSFISRHFFAVNIKCSCVAFTEIFDFTCVEVVSYKAIRKG